MKQYIPSEVHAHSGRKILTRGGFGVGMFVSGDVKVYPVEKGSAGAIAFAEPVREVTIIATGGTIHAAPDAVSLSAVGTGASVKARWLIPAGETRVFPLWSDELHVDGACYVEGRL